MLNIFCLQNNEKKKTEEFGENKKALQNLQDLQNFGKSSKANKICVKSLAKNNLVLA